MMQNAKAVCEPLEWRLYKPLAHHVSVSKCLRIFLALEQTRGSSAANCDSLCPATQRSLREGRGNVQGGVETDGRTQ